MKQKNNALISESHAVYFLRQGGFSILARNYRRFGIEIDILAKKNTQEGMKHFFVEVKQVQKKYLKRFYHPFSIRQICRYHALAALISSENSRFLDYSIALIILDENYKVIEFHENICLPND